MSATVPSSNISFSGLRTAYRNGSQSDASLDLENGTTQISLSMFTDANCTDGTTVPGNPEDISIQDDFRGKTFGATASSGFTFNLYLIDAYGDGWNGTDDLPAGLYILIDGGPADGEYQSITATSLSGVAATDANGGITLTSGAGHATSSAGTVSLPGGEGADYKLVVGGGEYESEITWRISYESIMGTQFIDFDGNDTPGYGTFFFNVDGSGVGTNTG